MRILIIEDEEKMARALRKGLEAEQYSVSVAQSGEEGFFLVSTDSPDLVILSRYIETRGSGNGRGRPRSQSRRKGIHADGARV